MDTVIAGIVIVVVTSVLVAIARWFAQKPVARPMLSPDSDLGDLPSGTFDDALSGPDGSDS